VSIEVSPLATAENFEESAYLKANPDVRQVVEHGMFVDGRDHFRQYGWRENRRLLLSPDLSFPRRRKLERLRPHLRADMPCTWDGDVANYLTPELRAFASVDETSNVSSNNYDPISSP
jgi:hypothetical protein